MSQFKMILIIVCISLRHIVACLRQPRFEVLLVHFLENMDSHRGNTLQPESIFKDVMCIRKIIKNSQHTLL